MREAITTAVILIGFAWGFADLLRRAVDLLAPWVKRCADNIALRVSPCPYCEGWGNDPDIPGATCPHDCAAARRIREQARAINKGRP